jgi:hypothetical protein
LALPCPGEHVTVRSNLRTTSGLLEGAADRRLQRGLELALHPAPAAAQPETGVQAYLLKLRVVVSERGDAVGDILLSGMQAYYAYVPGQDR